jgi:YVTN family beta-propeller protein
MGRKSYKALILLLYVFQSCKKDKPDSLLSGTPGATGNVYVVCEGNYGSGDASLYAYQPAKDSVYGDLYAMANNQTMGDVFQSMQHIGNHLFLCINNSNKIAVLNASNRKLTAALSIPQPRYILPVNDTKAYVSSLYSNKIYIINPTTLQVTGYLTIPANSAEEMCLYYNNIFTASWDTANNRIFEINSTTDEVASSIPVAGYAPQSVLLDKEQMLWILAGDEPEGKIATLTRIDPSTGNILKSYSFPATADPLKPVFNTTRDTLYFIEANYYGGTDNNGIYRMSINDASLPATAFVTAKPYQYFWALGVDPLTGYIYVGDPKGFIQKGSVYIYKQDGTPANNFAVGVGPGHFYFDE